MVTIQMLLLIGLLRNLLIFNYHLIKHLLLYPMNLKSFILFEKTLITWCMTTKIPMHCEPYALLTIYATLKIWRFFTILTCLTHLLKTILKLMKWRHYLRMINLRSFHLIWNKKAQKYINYSQYLSKFKDSRNLH